MITDLHNKISKKNIGIMILVVFVLLSGQVLASDTGQAIIGEKKTEIRGTDNSALIEADLENFDPGFKIEKIEEDTNKYYIKYTYINLVESGGIWEYKLIEKNKRISKKSVKNLPTFLAKEFEQEYLENIKKLKQEKESSIENGPTKRVEVTEYTGLIGKTLDLAHKIFPSYEATTTTEIKPALSQTPLEILRKSDSNSDNPAPVSSDNLASVYQDYISKNDPDNDNVFGNNDNCPNTHNPDQLDSDKNGLGDACDLTEKATSSPEKTTDIASSTTNEEAITTIASSSESDSMINKEGVSTNSTDISVPEKTTETEDISPTQESTTQESNSVGEVIIMNPEEIKNN